MVSFRLDNKIALISGGSRGIGEAIALTLAQYGAECILISRKIEGLETVKQKILDKGGKAEAFACHVGDMAQIAGLFEQVDKRYGRLDILINNAATNFYLGEMINAPEAAWNKTLEVNLKGPFFMIQHAVPLMERAGGGTIVNVASAAGVSPGLLQGVYSITKAGLISMTKAYAKELAPKKIRVNALLPGLTETRFSAALIENKELYRTAISRIPMGRHGQPREMAGAVLYLVSEASSYTTGAMIPCDGGMLI